MSVFRLSLVWLAGLVVASAASENPVDAGTLAVDDECDADLDGSCALQALQLRTVAKKRPQSSEQIREPQVLAAESTAEDGALATVGRDPVAAAQPPAGNCLCVFDVDRTLTAKQAAPAPVSRRKSNNAEHLHHLHSAAPEQPTCTGTRVMPLVPDTAYGGGILTLSPLATAGINQTFCNLCYLGACSHGDGSGLFSAERDVLLKEVLVSEPQKKFRQTVTNATYWSDTGKVFSPHVIKTNDKEKQLDVQRILDWYAKNGVNIPAANVFFFDDRADNVLAFQGTSFNAHQISCASRDRDLGSVVGLCGATVEEITPTTGVAACPAVPSGTAIPSGTVAPSTTSSPVAAQKVQPPAGKQHKR